MKRSIFAPLLAIFGLGLSEANEPRGPFGVPRMSNPPPPPPRPLPPLIRHNPTNEQMRRKGLKSFHIDGKEVWALNEKNAIRKAAKL